MFVFSTLLASRRFAAGNFAVDALNHPDSLGAFHTTAAIEQVLFDGGATAATTAGAHAQVTMAQHQSSEAELATIEQVTALYGQVLARQASREALDAALASAAADARLAERRRDAGTVTEADVLALAVHVATLQQRAIQDDGDLAILRAQLNRLAGQPLDRAFTALAPAPASAPTPPLDEVLARADEQRPERQRALAAATLAEQARRAARAALLPRVAAQAAFDVTGTRAFDRAGSWLVGGEVRWSLGLAGTEHARVTEATARATQARLDAEDARAQAQVDALTALRQLESARARQAVGQAMVAQARESARITRDRYEAGLARVNDVLQAATAVLDAEALRTSALADEFTSRARLSRATGRRP